MSCPPTKMCPGFTVASPEITDSSSSCPLPATPPMPMTSPARTLSVTSFSEVPNCVGEGSETPFSSTSTAPGWAPAARSGVWSVVPTISSAISRAVDWRGMHSPTTLPRRSTVAASHSARISSSLCEI